MAMALTALAASSLAQSPFPTFKGDSARTGKNATPGASGPGVAGLLWYHPNASDNVGGSIVVDNTNGNQTGTATSGTTTTLVDSTESWSANYFAGRTVTITAGTGAGESGLIVSNTATTLTISAAWATAPNATSVYSISGSGVSFTSGWVNPTLDQEAPSGYIPTGTETLPSYRYAPSIPSAVGSDPRVKQNLTDTLEVATYTFVPSDTVPRNYALSIYLPQGATGNTTVGFHYPARHFVYEVDYGAGATFVDVLDTTLTGTGWARLGNGGGYTTRTFSYDGVHPLKVKVYNTIARDSNGKLLDTPGANTLIYADAFWLSPNYGSIAATPTVYSWGAAAGQTRTVSAVNEVVVGIADGVEIAQQKGVVYSYVYSTGAKRWAWSPQSGTTGQIIDNQNAAVTAAFPFGSDTTGTGYYGADYFSAPITNSLAGSVTVSYEPVLQDGSYDVYVWLAGDSGTRHYGKNVQVEIDEGATKTFLTVDESLGGGWYRLVPPSGHAAKWLHDDARGNDLTVQLSNYSANGADATRVAYADAVWFVGSGTPTILSTPVQSTSGLNLAYNASITDNSGLASTPVTIVCAEDGRIYCVDSVGNADGTTNVYWVYPSLVPSSIATWSSTTTYNIGDFVTGSNKKSYRSIIAANVGHDPVSTTGDWEPADPNQVNGLDGPGGIAEMPTGFGMSSAAIATVGGRDRLFVATSNGRVICLDVAGRGDMNVANGVPGTTTRLWSFPSDYPSAPVASKLGAFQSSVAVANSSHGLTVYAGAASGRMYALDATGNTTSKTTTTYWTYPALSSKNLGSITTTPSVDFGSVFFGTAMSDTGSNPGAFLSLNADTGALNWTTDNAWTGDPLDNFLGGPVTVAATELGGGTDVDTVFVANQNRTIYAFDVAGGTGNSAKTLWSTRELNTGVRGALTYSPMTVYNNAGTQVSGVPILLIPTEDGRIDGLFASNGVVNRAGSKRAYEYRTADSLTASIAVGLNWMYAGDNSGNLYAFGNGAGGSGGPGGGTVVENNPDSATFDNAKIRFINYDDYERLLASPETETYAQILAATSAKNSFEWGETMYALAFDFPYQTKSKSGATINPPLINFSVSVGGKTLRNLTSQSRQLGGGAGAPAGSDGYAIIAFTFRGEGSNALPPGAGSAAISILSQYSTGFYQSYALSNPANYSHDFTIANPLAVTSALDAQSIGYSTSASFAENLVNGNPASTGKQNFATTFGMVSHGSDGTGIVQVYDRSLMVLVDQIGLTNVRVNRDDLAWQNGAAGIYKPLPAFAVDATGNPFEEAPNQYPNISLDYPNIKRSAIRAVKDPNGKAENPLYNGVTLNAPTGIDLTTADPTTRTLTPTEFDFQVSVPKYQPANKTNTFIDSAGVTVPTSGYVGTATIFVDPQNTGIFDITSANRPAYRTVKLVGNVGVDERFHIGTPIVDLGSLANGAGTAPSGAFSGQNPYSAGFGYGSMWKSFDVLNDGNSNLLNLRMVHDTLRSGDANSVPLELGSPSSDALAWMDADTNLVSDLDYGYYTFNSSNAARQVFLQKPRVGDRGPTLLSTNEIERANGNFGVTGGAFLVPAQGATGSPRVSVLVPIGFPSGSYSQLVRVFEDDNQDLHWNLDPSNIPLESYTDPSFELKYKVVETRLTNSYSANNSPMVDNLLPAGATPFAYQNLQPTAVRDGASGSMLVAWASDRRDASGNPAWLSTSADLPTAAVLDPRLRIYLASVQGAASTSTGNGTSPLHELNSWTPDSGGSRWFQQQVGPLPSGTLDSNFAVTASESLVSNTVQFRSPAFASTGFVDPLSGAPITSVVLAFIGDAQVQTPNGRAQQSKLFATNVTMNAGGSVTLTPSASATQISLDTEIYSRKGRPSVVQFAGTGVAANPALIFYSSAGSGQSALNCVRFNGSTFSGPFAGSTNAVPYSIPIPGGFESATGPSGALREYQGASGAEPEIELAFSGKLRGRSTFETFWMRFAADPAGYLSGTGQPLDFGSQVEDLLTQDASNGAFRARGLGWDMTQAFDLLASAGGAAPASILTGSATSIDPTTGVRVYPTRLGPAYVDPSLGTITFANQPPTANLVLSATYTPTVLRLSESASSAYNAPSILLDEHYASDPSIYWFKGTGTPVTSGDTTFVPNRLVATYGRAAAGAGQGARPYMKTMRVGIQLPYPIATTAGGNIVALTVAGASSYWQVDPAKGRIYFTAADEDRPISVAYTGLDNNGGQLAGQTFNASPTWIVEQAEQAIPIETAVNESNPFVFPDPNPGTQVGTRPPMFWMFWSSTRGGGSDIFFQTLAPLYTPQVGSK